MKACVTTPVPPEGGGWGHACNRQARSVAPEIFQAVEIALVAMEDVHDHLQVIEHDPLARRKTVDRGRAHLVILAQAGLDLTRDRFQMRLRSPRADDEEVGEGGNPAQIEDDEVFRFLVGGELGAGYR